MCRQPRAHRWSRSRPIPAGTAAPACAPKATDKAAAVEVTPCRDSVAYEVCPAPDPRRTRAASSLTASFAPTSAKGPALEKAQQHRFAIAFIQRVQCFVDKWFQSIPFRDRRVGLECIGHGVDLLFAGLPAAFRTHGLQCRITRARVQPAGERRTLREHARLAGETREHFLSHVPERDGRLRPSAAALHDKRDRGCRRTSSAKADSRTGVGVLAGE